MTVQTLLPSIIDDFQARLRAVGPRGAARAVRGRRRAGPDRPREPAERSAHPPRQDVLRGMFEHCAARGRQGDGREHARRRAPARPRPITCAFPDGRRVLANAILELEDGRIIRELDVLSGDPKHERTEGERCRRHPRRALPSTRRCEGYEGHFEHFEGGWTVGFETYTQDADLAPFFKGLPNDECQCEHMGYVIRARSPSARAGEEVFEAGDAYYVGPGPHAGALRRAPRSSSSARPRSSRTRSTS